jgi:TRAP-type mannitol/chloroaromatic compound transport system permease large subunit
LFIFMASVLAAAGLIEELFDVVYQILGGLKGGLATATIIASTMRSLPWDGLFGLSGVPPGEVSLWFGVV